MIKASDLSVMVVMRLKPISKIVHTALYAMGVRDILVIDDVDGLESSFRNQDPDVLIVLVEDAASHDPGLTLARRMRALESPNRYIPIVAVSPAGTMSAVRASINAGVHEFVAMPLSAEMLYRKMMHAIFVGWPIIDVESYFGPCRRRYADPRYKGVERRLGDASQAATASHEEREAQMDRLLYI